MKHLRKHVPYLTLLGSAHPAQKKVLIQSASRDQINTLSEILKNLLGSVLPITSQHRRQLRKYRKIILKITDRHTSLKIKNRLLLEPVSLVTTIFKPLLPLVEHLLK